MSTKTKSKTTRKRNTNRRNLIIGGCIAAVAAIIVIVVVVIANIPKPIDDSFFVSDGTKYVLNLDSDYVEIEDEYAPVKSHLVYFYSGDDVTSLKIYYEYATAEDAASAYEQIASENDGAYQSVYRDGKYVVLVANEADYEELRASDIKQQIEFMDLINRMRSVDSEE